MSKDLIRGQKVYFLANRLGGKVKVYEGEIAGKEIRTVITNNIKRKAFYIVKDISGNKSLATRKELYVKQKLAQNAADKLNKEIK